MATRARGPAGETAEAERVLGLLTSLGSTIFRQLLWQKASELDLTFAQSEVLSFVAEHPGCHMGEPAKAFGVTLPAITHIADRLEQKGLLVRGDDPGDRRLCVLELTRSGQALVEELQALRLRGMTHVLTRMSTADRQRLLVGLEALVDAGVGAADGDPRPGRTRRVAR